MDIDVSEHLGLVRREVRHGERDGKDTMSVVASRTFATTIDDLWDAVTNRERIPRWFLPISGDLRVGGRYELDGNASGEILACEPPRLLRITWEYGGDVSWVDVRLRALEPDVTELHLEHTAHPSKDWGDYGPGAVGVGWEQALLGIEVHLGGAPPVDHADALAWLLSPGGKDFVRVSSAAWGEAATVAGTDPDEANAAAERTRAAYTGEAEG